MLFFSTEVSVYPLPTESISSNLCLYRPCGERLAGPIILCRLLFVYPCLLVYFFFFSVFSHFLCITHSPSCRSALQSLHKACEVARCHNYYPGSLFLTWVSYYQTCISSDQYCINEWNAMQDVQSHRSDSPVLFTDL